MQMPPLGARETGPVEKTANGERLLEPLRPAATVRFQREAATIEPVALGYDDVEPLARQLVACSFGPLDQR